MEGSYLSLVLDPPQKLFCSPRTRSQEFFASRSDPVDFPASSPFRLPDGLEVAFLFHRMEEGIERSSAKIDFEAISDLEVNFVSPARLALEEPENDEV